MTEFTQAAEYYRSMTEKERESLADNLTESLMFENEEIRRMILGYFKKIDAGLEKNLRKRLRF